MSSGAWCGRLTRLTQGRGVRRRRACQLTAVLIPALLLAHAPRTGCDTNSGSATGIRQHSAPANAPDGLRAASNPGRRGVRRARRWAGDVAPRHSHVGSAPACREQGRARREAGLRGRRERLPAEIWIQDDANSESACNSSFRASSPNAARGGTVAPQSRWAHGGRCHGESGGAKTPAPSEVDVPPCDVSPCTPGNPMSVLVGGSCAHAHAHKLSAWYAALNTSGSGQVRRTPSPKYSTMQAHHLYSTNMRAGHVRGGDGADDRTLGNGKLESTETKNTLQGNSTRSWYSYANGLLMLLMCCSCVANGPRTRSKVMLPGPGIRSRTVGANVLLMCC